MHLKFNILCFFMLFYASAIFAQKSPVWHPIGLTVSGKNIQNGVEAFYRVSKSKNKDIILIKFVNLNNYAVNLEWNDAVYTKEQQWKRNEKADVRKCLTLNNNEIVSGNISDNSPKELIVKVDDFITNINDFNLYKLDAFKVSNITK